MNGASVYYWLSRKPVFPCAETLPLSDDIKRETLSKARDNRVSQTGRRWRQGSGGRAVETTHRESAGSSSPMHGGQRRSRGVVVYDIGI